LSFRFHHFLQARVEPLVRREIDRTAEDMQHSAVNARAFQRSIPVVELALLRPFQLAHRTKAELPQAVGNGL
jgi:hypothetical protein